jgi:hypothetical protein
LVNPIFDIEEVPIIHPSAHLRDISDGFEGDIDPLEKLLKYADGDSFICANPKREGVVFKNLKDPSVSFKIISNEYLLSSK